MTDYKSTVSDPHWREEELQWVSILATGDAAKGMALVYLQKMCTAFHEFEPAFREGALDAGKSDFFRRRLGNRVAIVIATMEANGLGVMDGFAELCELRQAVNAAQSLAQLADLTERVHLLGHKLCDSLAANR